MEIIIRKNSGFCAGVSYTVKKAEEYTKKNKVLYCLGELVHNERIIEDLKKKGILFVEDIEEIPNHNKVIFRAHGESQSTYEKAKEKDLEVLDLTCGKIIVIRNKIKEKRKDYSIIIIGKKNHPETIGTKSFSGDDSIIIEDKKEVKTALKCLKKDKIYVVAQTTFSSSYFDEIIEEIKKETNKEIEVDKTICNATEKRQEETKILAKEVNKMIIIGGKNSSNTKELYKISKDIQDNSYLIQGVEDLNPSNFKKDDRVGIMAGASTPEVVTQEVVNYLQTMV